MLILKTKISIPQLPKDVVIRKHLIGTLAQNNSVRTILVNAPAGYGKSVLATEWLQTKANRCWFSIGVEDNDFRNFVIYFIHSIKTQEDGFAEELLEIIENSSEHDHSYISTLLLNTLLDLKIEVTLVLDDFHLISNSDIKQLILTICESNLSHLQLLITSRKKLAFLPLHKLMSKGWLVEFGQDNLKFSDDEVGQLLNNSKSDLKSLKAASDLNKDLEGWPAALRLFLLADGESKLLNSKKGLENIEAYLFEDVLNHLSQSLVINLTQLSLLDRFNNDIHLYLDANSEKKNLIEWLVNNNVFIVSLGEGWYRFHHLFQDLLKQEANKRLTQVEQANVYHSTANWYNEKGELEIASDYYKKANAEAQIVTLILENRNNLINNFKWTTLEYLLNQLSKEVIGESVELLLAQCWVLDKQNKLDQLYKTTAQAEHSLKSHLESNNYKHLEAELNALKSIQLYLKAKPEEALALSEKSLKHLNPDLLFNHAYLVLTQALSYQTLGISSRGYEAAYSALKQYGINDLLKSYFYVTLSIIDWREVNFNELESHATVNLSIAKKNNLKEIQSYSAMYLAGLNYLKGEFRTAVSFLDDTVISNALSYSESVFLRCAILLNSRNHKGLHVWLQRLVDYANSTHNVALQQNIQNFKAELAYRKGKLAELEHWAQNFKFSNYEVVYAYYVPQFTYLKWLLSKGEEAWNKSVQLATHMIEHYQKQNNKYVLLYLYYFKALGQYALGNKDASIQSLERSLSIAEPSKCFVPYTELSSRDNPLLLHYLNSGYTSNVIEMAMDQINSIHKKIEDTVVQLSTRELDVLHLLVQRKRNKEIATSLGISSETVKRHASSIYKKMAVRNRKEAVSKAFQMEMIR